ncbi:hypothetical protein MCOR21_001718 [Pyricularia oryzae]|nr:hypothetical protein MCOR30_003526 [Pyricularia oryzae]KAI6340529.1 hypothetical protein MCOR28_006502 [Pyricularia oryzae]KAI6388037.1 hypothetical protein MCOR24_010850 [Pyricularia oryzae]KAI6435379.1 hypothetical protein MCOR21_001718 [Pyricularia oryzae]KAI6439511.1 hypothetical protein MCOR22_007883 [Pyricularia oryzae]
MIRLWVVFVAGAGRWPRAILGRPLRHHAHLGTYMGEVRNLTPGPRTRPISEFCPAGWRPSKIPGIGINVYPIMGRILRKPASTPAALPSFWRRIREIGNYAFLLQKAVNLVDNSKARSRYMGTNGMGQLAEDGV